MHLSTACLMTVALGLLSIVKSMPVQEITNGMSSNRQNPSASQQDPPGQLSGADHMESRSPGPYLSTSTPLLIKRGASVSSQRGQTTSNSQVQAPSAESPPLSPPPSPPPSYATEDNEVDQDPLPDYGSALRDGPPNYYERSHLRQGRTSLYTPDPAPDGSRLSTGVQRSQRHEWTGRVRLSDLESTGNFDVTEPRPSRSRRIRTDSDNLLPGTRSPNFDRDSHYARMLANIDPNDLRAHAYLEFVRNSRMSGPSSSRRSGAAQSSSSQRPPRRPAFKGPSDSSRDPRTTKQIALLLADIKSHPGQKIKVGFYSPDERHQHPNPTANIDINDEDPRSLVRDLCTQQTVGSAINFRELLQFEQNTHSLDSYPDPIQFWLVSPGGKVYTGAVAKKRVLPDAYVIGQIDAVHPLDDSDRERSINQYTRTKRDQSVVAREVEQVRKRYETAPRVPMGASS